MQSAIQLVSVQAGRAATYPPVEEGGSSWRSAIVKTAVAGPVWVRALGLEGDEQADLRNHGGEYRAVNAYPSEHYERWHADPALAAMTGGAFGENFTTRGLLESTTCIGDVFRVGEALVEVTQPRGPCYKLNRRWGVDDLQQRAEDEHRFGWYLRVKEEGRVQAGDAMELVAHPFPEWTITRVWDTANNLNEVDAVRALMAVPALSPGMRASLEKKLSRA